MEKCGKMWKNGRFSGRLRPDWGNTARAAMAGLVSIGTEPDLCPASIPPVEITASYKHTLPIFDCAGFFAHATMGQANWSCNKVDGQDL